MNIVNQFYYKCSFFLILSSCAYLKQPVELNQEAKSIKIVRDTPPKCRPISLLDFRTTSTNAFQDAMNQAKNEAAEKKGNLVQIKSMTSRGEGSWVRLVGEIFECSGLEYSKNNESELRQGH